MPFINAFLPSPGRGGVMSVLAEVGVPGPALPVVAGTATTKYRLGCLPRASFVSTVGIQCSVALASASAATAQLFKRNANGAVSVALTGTFNLLTITVDVVTAIPITATELNRAMKVGDYLVFDVVAAGAVTTQPSDLFFTVEVALRN